MLDYKIWQKHIWVCSKAPGNFNTLLSVMYGVNLNNRLAKITIEIRACGGIGVLCMTKCRNGEKFVGQPEIIVFNYLRYLKLVTIHVINKF